jgi:hypothetical protein
MIEFILYDGCQFDKKLVEMWDNDWGDHQLNYEDFIRTLEPKIINAKANEDYESITITFESEEHLTWFLIRWS